MIVIVWRLIPEWDATRVAAEVCPTQPSRSFDALVALQKPITTTVLLVFCRSTLIGTTVCADAPFTVDSPTQATSNNNNFLTITSSMDFDNFRS